MRQVSLSSRDGAKVAAAMQDHPNASDVWIARRLGISESYVRRVRKLVKSLAGGHPEDAADLDENEEDEAFRPIKPASSPTNAQPGSEAKVRVLMARYEAREELWHPDDVGRCRRKSRKDDDDPPAQAAVAFDDVPKERCMKCKNRASDCRGVCPRCYWEMRDAVRKGKSTWDEFVSQGWIQPPRVKGRQYAAFGLCVCCRLKKRIHATGLCRRCYNRRND